MASFCLFIFQNDFENFNLYLSGSYGANSLIRNILVTVLKKNPSDSHQVVACSIVDHNVLHGINE